MVDTHGRFRVVTWIFRLIWLIDCYHISAASLTRSFMNQQRESFYQIDNVYTLGLS